MQNAQVDTSLSEGQMTQCSRRRYLGALGAIGGLAGCIEGNAEEGDFLVTNTEVVGPIAPDGVRVRVTIENEKPDRQTGTLEITLEYRPDGEVVDSWQKTDELSVSRGTSPRIRYEFMGVREAGAVIPDYAVVAEIRTAE